MDAQNTSDADQTKPPVPSDRARSSQPDPGTQNEAEPRRPAEGLTPAKELQPSQSAAVDADGGDDRDSDAETIVLPGKDGHSPSKIRKMRQEDKGDAVSSETKRVKSPVRDGHDRAIGHNRSSEGLKKRRLSSVTAKDRARVSHNKDASGDMSSVPGSPLHEARSDSRRRSHASSPRSSDSENNTNRRHPPRESQDRTKAGERTMSVKRKALKADSEDDEEHSRARRQRTSSIGTDGNRVHKDRGPGMRNRSHSPATRAHRRSVSTQLPNQGMAGLSQKKRRLPPPLQSTEQHSDDSDRSGSPMPRSSKLRSLTTPHAGEASMSPAKIVPHKKHLDAHGQTFLARACARGEYEAAKKRLGERREDLNVADYAGNTPLQIAAINGCEDIVKLLIDAGCSLDCVNYDKETPLLDAVDNGHLGVVKLLLDAGVNPRKANVNGQEPLDRISEDTENAEEIRAALIEAKKRAGERTRTSEDRHSHPDVSESRDAHAPDSPRHSPAHTVSGSTGRRGGTVRSTKTRNDLLYMNLDDKTLRQAAGRGDEETVARILQVKEGFNDPESMVAAARGGHDLVMQLLLGLGGANPDPPPVPSLSSDVATPILAAIGQENIKVVELLLEQGGFDPTRRFKHETYYEIARRRQGTNWKEEEHLLKNAYDEYKRTHKETGKTSKSPGRREKEREREEKRGRRDDARDEGRPVHKRNPSSPSGEGELRRKPPLKVSSPKERRRRDSAGHGDENSHKRVAARYPKDDKVPSTHTSDREPSPTISQKAHKNKSRDTDQGASSDGEALKPRRKLVSKGELRVERVKHRRSSMASNGSSLREPSSPHDSRNEEPAAEKSKMSEKYHDRAKALKREESKDAMASADSSSKRHRSSTTPDRQSHGDKDDNAIPQKRRRLDADSQEKRPRNPASPEARHAKLNAPRENGKAASKVTRKTSDTEGPRDSQTKRDGVRKDTTRITSSEASVQVKSEDVDVDMPDVESAEAVASREKIERKRKKEAMEQEERQRAEDRERAEKKKADERKRLEEKEKEEAERREAEALEAKRKREQEEEEEAQREAAAQRARLEREEKQRLIDEEKRLKEEEERVKREEERKRKEKQQEEERLRREQLEREAAEAARRQREEEERKEKDRRERAHREELERKRAAREAEQRRLREEQERIRLEKLPPLLRWLDTCANPKLHDIATRMNVIDGCRYDTLNTSTLKTSGTPEGREEWVLNTDVALLLGEKDLSLSRCTLTQVTHSFMICL